MGGGAHPRLKAAVTGSSGFQGKALVAKLALENEVQGFDIAAEDAIDLRHEEPDFRGCEVVYHLAARVGGNRFTHGPQDPDILLDNCLIDENVLRGAVRSEVKRFVYASSGSVYPPSAARPFREQEPIDFSKMESGTALAKAVGEKLVLYLHLRKALPKVAILRPFNVYGPGAPDSHVIPELMRRAREEPKLEVTGGDSMRSFLFVDDAVDAYLLAGKFCYPHPVNVAGKEVVTVRWLAEMVLRSLGRTDAPVVVDGALSFVYGSSTLAETVYGWRDKVKLADGLRRTAVWYNGVHPPPVR